MCWACADVMMQEATECGQGFQFSEMIEGLLARGGVSITLVASVWVREGIEMAAGNRRWS